ncbi:MptD family putative ECF transporter S component [Paenibacillus sp. 481]|uniref:MptD family putative ECF transporter S component n=1 Tax=Paenibacillus sp. 481 TaxID=2835869 RepID=UPI001E2A128A|nr:MptD family putative ECF transporter S component [Paenibacillus sp. 481]UHA72703.1 MptD family putative ECF transporter S component [Paenibacillus sp. 481]
MSTQSTSLKTKDYVLIGIFSILIFIVNGIVSTLLTPVMFAAMPLISGVCLFFSAIIYLIMAIKVGKRGVILLLGLVTGLVYAIMGIPLMLPFFVAAGLLGEAVLLKGNGNQYKQVTRQSLAYASYGMLFGIGGYATIHVYGSDVLEAMFSSEMSEIMRNFAYSPMWMLGSMLFSFVLTLLGCVFASNMLKKHFMKAGMIK